MRLFPFLFLIAFPALADPPVAADDFCTTIQDAAAICPDPLLNDTEPDGEFLFYVVYVDMLTGAEIPSLISPTRAGGTIERTSAGLRYVPRAGFCGDDHTTYEIEDMGNGGRVTGNVYITVTCTSTAPVAISHLTFDDGSGPIAVDKSGNDNNCTLVGPTWGTGELVFDGVDDYCDLGPLDVAGTGITLAARFNAKSLKCSAADCRLISKAKGTNTADHWWMLSSIKSGGEIVPRARIKAGGSTITVIGVPGSVIEPGVEHFVAVSYDGAVVVLYLARAGDADVTRVGSAPKTDAVDIDSTLPAWIGGQPPKTSRPFDGAILETWIFDKGLDAAEVRALFLER